MRCLPTSLVTVALLASAAAAHGQRDQLYTATREQLDVTKIVIAQQKAWNDGDMDAYLKFFKDAPDTIAMLSTPVRGLDAIRTAFHTNFPNKAAMGSLEQSDLEVRELGENFALAIGKYHLVRGKKEGGGLDGTFSDVLEKTPAGWRIIFTENN